MESCMVILLTMVYLWEVGDGQNGEAGWYAGLYGVWMESMDYIKAGVWIVPFWSVLVYAFKELPQELGERLFMTSIRYSSCVEYMRQLFLKTIRKAVGMGCVNCLWFIVVCTAEADIFGYQSWINWKHICQAVVLYILGVVLFSAVSFWVYALSQNLYLVWGSQIAFFSILFFVSYMPEWMVRVLPVFWTSLIYSSEFWKDGYEIWPVLLLEILLMAGIYVFGNGVCKQRKLGVLR